ncbi:hypothetical protein C8Q77DRAFT_1095262 [Trametes polyzona]|nr:hypothetical protein C8Q77DRAFT_1095262 [Trametes polyzona]
MLPASIVSGLADIGLSARHEAYALDARYYTVRNLIIDSVARTISLCLFTFIVAATVYIVISRRWKDAIGAIILISVLPDSLSTFTTWVGTLSELAQAYALMEHSVIGVKNAIEAIDRCALIGQCEDPYPTAGKPAYIGHGCVGTGLIAAHAIIEIAVLHASMGIFIQNKPGNKVIYGSILLVPFLATCASAIMHVKNVCSPDPIIFDSGLGVRLERGWEVFRPHNLDSTTFRLLQLSRFVALPLVIYLVWKTREEYASLRDSATRSDLLRWTAMTYIVPVAIRSGWVWLHKTYAYDPSWPVLRHIFFSCGNSLLYPLLDIYPGLAILIQRLSGDALNSGTTERNSPPGELEKGETSVSPKADASITYEVEKETFSSR